MQDVNKRNLIVFVFSLTLITAFSAGFMYSYYFAGSGLRGKSISEYSMKYADSTPVNEADLIDRGDPGLMENKDISLGRECEIVFNKRYDLCSHTVEEKTNIYQLYEGLKYQDIKDKFDGWKIEDFKENQIKLSKDFPGKCPEHYIVKLVDGKVVVFYEVPQDGKDIKEVTNITEKNIRTADRAKLKEGMKIDTVQNLAGFLEDFGS